MKLYDISLTLSAQSIRWVTAQPLELIERKRMSLLRKAQEAAGAKNR